MKSLKLYVVSSHVDKPLEGNIKKSKYEVPIQAGTALTDKRICDVNDYDGFSESISERNRRYSECTAIYWMGKHIDSDYVGVEHYRRRFVCTDEELESLLEDGVDIITTKPMSVPEGLKQNYVNDHYGGDWVYLFDLLRRHDPDNYGFYESLACDTSFHFGNINIMKAELFREYCDWAFPIVDEYYKNAPEKMDAYNRRDAGFIMERLSHFFVKRMIRDGKKVVEREVKNCSTHAWAPADECDVKDFDAVCAACDRLYEARQITKCCNVLGEAEKYGADKDERLSRLSDVLYGGILERMQSQITMYEYLPPEMKDSLEHLCESFGQLKQMVTLYAQNPTDEMKQLFANYLGTTGYSMILVNYILENMN